MVFIGISGTLFAGKANETYECSPESPMKRALSIFNGLSEKEQIRTIADDTVLETLIQKSGLRERWTQNPTLQNTDVDSFYKKTNASKLIPDVKRYCFSQLSPKLQGIIRIYEQNSADMDYIKKDFRFIQKYLHFQFQFFQKYMFYYENEL